LRLYRLILLASDRPLDDVFALQDEITLNVVGAIQRSLREAEIERVKHKRPEKPMISFCVHFPTSFGRCSDQLITTAIRGDCPRFHRQQMW
jgi:hypothetical protein